MKTLLLTCLLLLPVSAHAFPFTYEFLDGGLTGTYTTEAPNELGVWSAVVWHITSPLGIVWDSSNQDQQFNERTNYGWGLILHPELRQNYVENYLLIQIDGPTLLTPNQTSGIYSWETAQSGQVPIYGTGNWAQIQDIQKQTVPIPSTVWITLGFFVSLACWINKIRSVTDRN